MKYYHASGQHRHARKRRLYTAAGAAVLAAGLCITSLWMFRHSGEGVSVEPDRVTASGLRIGGCGNGEKGRRGLEYSSVPQLKKLAEYEAVCGETATGTMSVFVNVPTTFTEATIRSKATATTLKELARYDVSPVIFLEPHVADGTVINLNTYRGGGYDAMLDAFFAGIKREGITDQQMGLWTPQPEGNTSVWGNNTPQAYADIVRRTVTIQKKYFPDSKASILLDSKTSGSSTAGTGYSSLVPYVQNIPKGLIDSAGLQGFPAGSAGSSTSATVDPKVYLRTDLAVEAAKTLGVKQLWLNTGTFRHFAKDGFEPMELSPAQRQDMLAGVLEAADSIKAAGLQSAIHLFAKDKLVSSERTDWSYWTTGQAAQSPATAVFKTFIHDARKHGVPVWLYDY